MTTPSTTVCTSPTDNRCPASSSSSTYPSSPVPEEIEYEKRDPPLRLSVPGPTDSHTTHSPEPSSTSTYHQRRRNSRLERCKAWLRGLGSLELENSGSVARDHLAAERTFLAYVRTSLGCAAAGVGEYHSLLKNFQGKLSLVDLALVQLLTMSATPPPHKLKLFGQILGALIELFGLTLIVTGASDSPLIFFPGDLTLSHFLIQPSQDTSVCSAPSSQGCSPRRVQFSSPSRGACSSSSSSPLRSCSPSR